MSPQEKSTMMQTLANGWRESGMTQFCYASENNISVHTLKYWLYKGRPKSKSSGSFVQLKSLTTAQEYIIRYPNGIELKLPYGTPAEYIRALINL